MNPLVIFLNVALLAATSADRLDHLVRPNAYGAGAGAYSGNAAPYHYENVNNGDGSYRFSYETGNGISAHESGSPRVAGSEGAAVAAEGGFSYHAPDGRTLAVTYTADERGFRPSGAHLPTPPPIPEAILRSLEYNRQHPSSDDGSYNGGIRNGFRY